MIEGFDTVYYLEDGRLSRDAHALRTASALRTAGA